MPATGEVVHCQTPPTTHPSPPNPQIKRYLNRPIGSEPPHIFAIADRMYRLLLASGDNQVRPPHSNPLVLPPTPP